MKLSLPTPKAAANPDDLSWLSKTRTWLFALIILFSSTQLGLHFWPSSSFVYGVRIDYLSPTLYFLDFLILGYLLLSKSSLLITKNLQTLLFILFANLLFSLNPLATLSWSFHLTLYFLFINHSPKTYFRRFFLPLLLISMGFQTTLGLAHVLLGHSLGNFLYLLGERSIAAGRPGLAMATFWGHTTLRAYGTFSHPNILAGWLAICSLIIIRLKPSLKITWLGASLAAIGIFLTQSRSAALMFFGIVVPFNLLSNWRQRIGYFALLFLGLYFLLSTGLFGHSLDLSLSQRQTLQSLSLSVIRQYPVFGTGANSSLVAYPTLSPSYRLLQPDHNSLTLFLSWFGIFGVISLFSKTLFRSLLPLFPIILLDHYLLTSPQGLFILLIYLRATMIIKS